MTTKGLSILIADDELPARKKLLAFLSQQSEPADIYEAADGLEAYKMIVELNPDIVFLDVQMPGMTGLDVLENLSVRCCPHIVFVTAFDKYAIKAFEINAVDYLLKPFDQKRFDVAYRRALEKSMQKANNNDALAGFLNEIKKDKKYAERLLVNTSGKYFFITIDEVIYIEAEEKYVQLHTIKGKYLIRETMNNMEMKLNPDKFTRIHRSFIVNVAHISEMKPWSHGDYVVILKNGVKLNFSRRYKENLFGERGSKNR